MSRKMSRKLEVRGALAVCLFCFFTVWKVPQFLHRPETESFLPTIAKKLIKHARNEKDFGSKAVSQIGEHENVGVWKNARNIVQIVNTRFMEHQHDLENLGIARLDLFRTFTLPSIWQQTNQGFLWIIWTNSRLRGKVLDEIVGEIARTPNTVLLGSEQENDLNFRHISGLTVNELENIVIAGNKQLLLDYKAAAESRLLIETNLEAGDALTKNFIDSIQAHAVSTIGQSLNTHQIEVFCPERHFEWRYYKPDDEDHWKGHLIQFHNKDFCINSGLSVAYHLEANASKIKKVLQTNGKTRLALCKPNQGKRPRRTQERCTGKGNQTRRLIKESPHMKHMQACPEGSYRCTDPNIGSISFGRPSFAIPSETRTCQVAGTSETIDVKVTPSRYSTGVTEQSGVDLDVVSPNYMLSAVYLKASDGGNLYDWGGGEGGARRGSFVTPRSNKYIDHVDICVVPTSKICGTDAGIAVQKTAKALERVSEEEPLEVYQREAQCLRTLNLLNDDTIAKWRNYFQSAVLISRTPAAADLVNVFPKTKTNSTVLKSVPENTFESEMSQEHAWVILMHDFGIELEEVTALRENFEEKMEIVLADALKGQCKGGYSCEESTKGALQELLRKVRRRTRKDRS